MICQHQLGKRLAAVSLGHGVESRYLCQLRKQEVRGGYCLNQCPDKVAPTKDQQWDDLLKTYGLERSSD